MNLDWFIYCLKEFYSTQWENQKTLNSPNLNRQGNSSNTYLMIVSETFKLHACQFEFSPNFIVEFQHASVSFIHQSYINSLTIGTKLHSFFPNSRNSVSLSHCWNIILCVGKLTHMNILSSHHFKGKESSDHGLPNKTSTQLTSPSIHLHLFEHIHLIFLISFQSIDQSSDVTQEDF